jgi:hypothetical protein
LLAGNYLHVVSKDYVESALENGLEFDCAAGMLMEAEARELASFVTATRASSSMIPFYFAQFGFRVATATRDLPPGEAIEEIKNILEEIRSEIRYTIDDAKTSNKNHERRAAMTQAIESAPRLDAARASNLLASYLRILGNSSAESIPDYFGSALESLLKPEIMELGKIGAAEPGDLVALAGCCGEFTAKATFIAINESPQEALLQISAQLDDLRGTSPGQRRAPAVPVK